MTTKIHAIVDALGNPLAIRLTGGQVHDITQAEALLAEVEPQAIIADKGYDADGFIEALIVRRIEPVIPPKARRKVSRQCDFASTPNAISSSVSSMPSNNSEASQLAMKKLPATSLPESISLVHSLGSNEDTA